jgi:hypothetical protein
MKKQSEPPGDDYQIRCPRLGHLIPFSYCRFENRGLPCFKTLDCWYDHFLIEDFLRKELVSEEWDKTFSRPAISKTASLVELIEQARKRMKEDKR